MNITLVGHVCIDHNITEHARFTSAGGSVMFMEKIFRLLPETKTTIVSSYGTDFLKYNTDRSVYPTSPTSTRTLIYENVIKDNHRTQRAKYRNLSKPVAIDESLSKILSHTDICVVGTLLPNFTPQYIEELCGLVPKQALKILLPQGYFRMFDRDDRVMVREFSEWKKVLKHFQFAIVSHEDHPQMTRLAHAWSRNIPTCSVVVTKKSQGADLVTPLGSQHFATNPVSETDIQSSVGSGDIFSAGFAYEFWKTKNLRLAMQFANTLAGYCLQFTPDTIDFSYEEVRNTNLLTLKNKPMIR